MELLQLAKPENAFLKMGIYGEAGSGKSFTSALVAIGLYNYIKTKKPIGWADTETGSDFLIPQFQKNKISLVVAKTRAFVDLLGIVDEAQKTCSILIIDSITHFWNDLVDSYLKKNSLTRISLPHWQILKKTWREFTSRYINSKIHIILAGRSADKWEEVEEEDGAKELRKVGTKMRAEVEISYEPSLLVEMELRQLSPHAGGTVVHRAYVQKDRFDAINGMHFDNPGFDAFLPHVQLLNLGGEHKAVEQGRDSQGVFEDNNIGERKFIKREILIEKIENEIKKLHPGQTGDEKTARIALFEEIFGTNSWTEISRLLPQEKLQAGLAILKGKNLPESEKESKPKTKGGKK
jgi:hypothetical protein